MSTLHQKLERLKEKQAQVERQLAAQAAAENAVVARAFALILESSPGAYRSAQASTALSDLSVKERTTFDTWLSRIHQPTVAQTNGSTEPHQFASTRTDTGSTH